MLEKDLTPGEKLWLNRRRLQKSMRKRAEDYDVSLHTYWCWEQDDPSHDIPDIDLGGIDPGEHYAIVRRRANMSIHELAREMRVSRADISLMERGKKKDCSRLQEYWGH